MVYGNLLSASSDNKQTYNKRGIEADADNIVLEGLYLNTVNIRDIIMIIPIIR